MTNYGLDPEKKAFSYTREELFSCIKRIIAHPHTHLTSHDEARALAILVVIDDYLANFTHRGGDGEYYIPECDEIDFTDFVRFKLCIDDYDGVDVNEILK